MATITLYGILLFIVWSAPSLLTLSRYTYDLMSAAHFVTFLAAVVLFVLMGRSLTRYQLSRLATGLIVGALVGAAGSVAESLIRRLPLYERTFVARIPNVPPQAALTMLQLHFWTSTILSAVMFALLLGGLGAIATWWGGRGQPATTSSASHQ
ncbi:MAG: hypothetical protein C7B45_14885 [Sulfobacillus acidophilus]|uniref:Uncharacterized protein n=1 Tax=Sulfobacillus acidophilus TaxID=53633 RepID=A0A2T2WDY2_9FIRM|nr:MAG: hypothetical protein C7B45_14885 [Sulfobacillus acidophilus]